MRSVLVSENISEKCERALLSLGFHVIKLPRARGLGTSAVASHPDSLIFHHGSTLITSCDYCDEAAYVFSELRELYPDVSIRFCSDSFGEKYPEDCIYNAAVCGEFLFAREESLSSAVKEYAAEHGLTVIPAKQGYPACATLILGNGRVITADRGLAKIYNNCKLKVTIIEQNGIALPPYEYGFIGGASGVFQSTVYFLGDISGHPSADIILRQIEEAGYRAHSLSDEPLRDLGGLIFLGE